MRQVAQLGHIILLPSEPVFALSPYTLCHILTCPSDDLEEQFEDTKGVIRSRKTENDRKYSGQKCVVTAAKEKILVNGLWLSSP